jgi:4-hydroxybenzoate polyprenyltransferase
MSWKDSFYREAAKWAGFVKLSHTVFALPFALASMVIAARHAYGWPGWRVFLLILLCMTSARGCAMAFNRIADRDFDRANPRTANRHLATGAISLAGAWAFCLVSAAVFVAGTNFLNPVCFALSPVALVVVCFYSLTKRFTDFTHVYLGIALALAPIGAWLAVRGNFRFLPFFDGAVLPLLLASAVVFWLVGFDIIYALQDYDFDRKKKLGSLVVRWGPKNALDVAFLSHLLMWALLFVLGLICLFRVAYFTGLIIILLCLMLEHWLARRRSLNWIQNAFFRLNGLVSLVFLAVTTAEVVFPQYARIFAAGGR